MPEPLIRLLLPLLLCCVSLPASAEAGKKSYCALVVTVVNARGAAVPNVPVLVAGKDHLTVVEAQTDGAGRASICDLPLKPLDVVVGKEICGSVMVRSIQPVWPDTVRLKVVYAAQPCNHLGVSAECLAILRVTDQGKPLAGAKLTTQSHIRQSGPSDARGRIMAVVRQGEVLQGTVGLPGYVSLPVSQVCTDPLELPVALTRQ